MIDKGTGLIPYPIIYFIIDLVSIQKEARIESGRQPQYTIKREGRQSCRPSLFNNVRAYFSFNSFSIWSTSSLNSLIVRWYGSGVVMSTPASLRIVTGYLDEPVRRNFI